MVRLALVLALALVGLGCSRSAPTPTPAPLVAQAKEDPQKSTYERYRSGLYLLDTAAADVVEARQAAEKAKAALHGDARETLLDVLDMLDNSGDNLTEMAIEPPSPRDFDHRFAFFDDQRLKAIATANDSLMELKDARGLLEGLNDSKAGSGSIVVATSRLTDAIDGLAEAITTLGGKLEETEP